MGDMFEEICRNFEHEPWLSTRGDVFANLLDAMRVTTAYPPDLMDDEGNTISLEIGWFLSDRYEAFACTKNNTDVIAIGSGTLIILEMLARALVSDSCFMTELSDIEESCSETFSFGDTRKTLPTSSVEWINLNIPAPNRVQAASDLRDLAILYVAHHEFAHVKNGHTQLRVIGEENFIIRETIDTQTKIETATILQTLEFDADMSSIDFILKISMNPKVELVGGREKWLTEGLSESTVLSAVILAISAISMNHFIIDSHEESVFDNYYLRSHPPGLVRFEQSCRQIEWILFYRMNYSQETANILINIAADNFIGTMRKILPNSFSSDRFEIAKTVGAELRQRYGLQWKKLHPILDNLKRGGILAPAEPPDAPL